MTTLPSVSIVVPAYNAAEYVTQTIESLLAQNHRDLEIILVDDGSTDGTGDLAAAFGQRIRLLRQANAGQSAAMTAGWAMATGEFLGYLSADDRMKPGAVRRCAEELAARPGTVLVYPDFDIIDAQSARQASVRAPDFSRHALYAQLHCLPGPGALFRRTAYEKAGAWSSDLRQIPDLDFFLRLALGGDFHHVPEVLAEFRMHTNSTTYRAVPFARGEEPVRMVDAFFAREDLPEDIREWQSSTRAHAHLLAAAIHGRSGRSKEASRHIARAAAQSPGTMLSRKAVGFLLLIARHAFAAPRP